MTNKLKLVIACLFFLAIKTGVAQTWVEMMQDPSVNFYDVQRAFNDYFDKSKQRELRNEQKHEARERKEMNEAAAKGKLDAYFKEKSKEQEEEKEVANFELYKRWEDYMKPRLFPSGDRSVMINAMQDYLDTYGPASEGPVRAMGGSGTPAIAAANWTIIGPTTSIPSGGGAGRVNFVRFDPLSTNTIYVGSPGGGFWKTTNGGSSWATTTDQLPIIGCTDLAVNPLNGQILYLATGDGEAQDTYSIGIYKSTDGGATWNVTGLSWAVTNGRSISRLLVNPTNPNTLFAATSNGIYKTINAGTTWTQVTGTNGLNFKDIEYRPTDTTTIYACTTTRFYKSTNAGTTFTNITSGLPATTSVSRLAIGVTAADPTYVYVLAANATNYGYQGLYRSTDNGTTFTTRSTTPNLLGFNSTGSDAGGQGWYTLSIAVAPTNKDLVLVGGVNVWKSTNGGTSWTINAHWTGTGAPYVHADIHALEFIPGSATTYFAGCDGGLFKTTSTGSSWSDLSNGLQISEAYRLGCSATSNNLLVTGLQDNGTVRNNGTATWNYIQGGDGMEALIDFTNANVQYGELYYGQINRTTTGGNLTTSIVGSGGTGVNADGDWVTPYIINPQKATTLVVGKAQAYRSRNRGTSWSALGTISGGTGNLLALAYAPSDSNYLYMAKMDKFYASTNSGTSFTDRTTGLPVTSASISYIAVASNNPQHVWVTFSGYSAANKVWYSANAGASWTVYTTGLPNIPANCIVYQNGSTNDALYVGTDVGVYYRDNTAGSWVAYNTGLPNVAVKELEIQYAVSKLRAATFGRGIWQSDLYNPGTALPVADFAANRTNICVGDCINFTDLSTGSPTAWSWSFPGAATGASSVQNPTGICYNTAGTYNVTLTATNVNGSNSITKTAYITVSGTTALPLVEGFEGATYVPTGWFLNNPDADNTWAQTTAAGGYGTSTHSAVMDNYSPATTIAGTIDELYTPKYSFTGLTSATMTFDVAYARYNATYQDSLSVFVSTDCGATWTSVYAKGGFTGLQTAADNGTSAFVPTSTQWRTETVNMTPYCGQSNVSVKFQNRSGWGQMMYLDNINITGVGAPTASVSIVSNDADNVICAGTSVTFTATPTNGGTTPSYQWQVNGVNVGTNSPTYTTTTLTTGAVVTCIMTSSLSPVTGSPATSNSITMTVNAVPATPTASSNSPVCSGTTLNLTTPTVSGATYSWSGPGSYSASTQNPTRPSATTAMSGTYSVTVTVGGCTSAAGTTAVTVNATPSTPTASSNSPVCAGSTLSLTTATVSGATYHWSGPGSYTASTQNPNRPSATTAMSGTYSVTVTVGGCTSAAGTTAVTVNAIPATPTASSNSPVCSGTTLNLTTPIVSGATYSWSGPGSYSASTQNPTRPSATTAMSGTYSVTVTVGGCTSAAGTTAVTVNASPSTPTASSNSPVCAGSTLSLTTATVSGATYHWSGPGSYTASTQNPNRPSATTAMSGTYSVTVTVGGCTSAAGTTAVTVNAIPATPTASNTGPYCGGQTISLSTATVSGATYSWSGPGSYSASTQNPTRPSATTAMSGTYSVTVTVGGCTSAAGTTTVSVNSSVTPTVSTSASPTGSICSGTSVTFTATPAGGGTTPGYLWQLNGNPIGGATSSTYTTTGLNNGDIITCVLTSSSSCASPTTATSAPITMAVTASVTPAVSIVLSSGSNPMCDGSSATFTATISNGGATPVYQWQLNGSNVGTNSATYSTSTLSNGDVVTCILTSSSTCASPASVTSSGITMVVNPIPATPVITQSGMVLTSSASSGNQWYVNGNPIPGETNQSYTVTANGNYTVIVTVAGCSSAPSNSINITNTGIDAAVLFNDLSIFPNPNDGLFTLSFKSDEASDYTIELINALGQLIYHEELKNFKGRYSKNMTVVEYGKGIYTLTISSKVHGTVQKVIVY